MIENKLSFFFFVIGILFTFALALGSKSIVIVAIYAYISTWLYYIIFVPTKKILK
tara:strand:+ start:956 stop:1120 length:165 start_codon:yes stop_codon:yes gene_type:complete